MDSRKKIFSGKIYFMISFFFGIIISTESNYLFFSLNLNRLNFINKSGEKFFWEYLNPLAIRYSPFFFLYWNNLKIKFEETIPTCIQLERLNFFKFIISEKQRNVLITVKWNNNIFFVSDDDAIWFIDHPLNKEMNFFDNLYGVYWHISDTFPSPIQGDSTRKDKVYSSNLPITLFKYWKKCFSLHGWYKFAEDLLLERRAGKYIFVIALGGELKGTKLILDGNAEGMNERMVAVDDVLQSVRGAGKKSIIDATYQDKIVVKSVSDDL